MEIFDILGPHSYYPVSIEVKFYNAKQTHVLVSPANFHVNRCNGSPPGEKLDFWPVTKCNVSSFQFPRDDCLQITGKFSYFGAAFLPPTPVEVKFCIARRTDVLVDRAKFDVNRCNESPLWGETPDFCL